MQALSLAYLRNHLDEVLELIDGGEVVITLDSGENAVLIKESELRSLRETLHLLATPFNSEHLQASLNQARADSLAESKPE
ncbi:MAG TPA: type II toxin-antitoxin system Phd/YefM family antitoxin [Burkholderiaceae bacterium]|jgi:antitoxin YefM|nr:type II toxin-antitoxin system Phd/YefM family antitoxin [Burkholderiaceae bacterium]